MFTWYWLADLCADEGIDFVLGHALYMRAIHGGKAKNDKIAGRILGLVMLYEIENITRFPRQQDFASYCRLVKPAKESNGKSYGHSGKKMGNAHLRWAFGEAVVLMLKGNKLVQEMKQRLASKHGKGKAMAIMSHRLGRAVYYMLKNQVPFDQDRFLCKGV